MRPLARALRPGVPNSYRTEASHAQASTPGVKTLRVLAQSLTTRTEEYKKRLVYSLSCLSSLVRLFADARSVVVRSDGCGDASQCCEEGQR